MGSELAVAAAAAGIPFAPGDRADIAGRVIGQEPNDVLKQPVISENRTGAGRTIAPNKGFIAA